MNMNMFWFFPHIAIVISSFIAFFVIAHVLRQQRSSQGIMAWLLFFVLVPYIGIPFYLAFSIRKINIGIKAKKHYKLDESLVVPFGSASRIDRMLRSYNIPGACHGNKMILCKTGKEGYEALVKIIDSAKKTLYIETFIFSKDEVGCDILQRLIKKAKEGIEIKLLIDAVGSFCTWRYFFKPLIQVGGKVAYFMPIIHNPIKGKTNLRNHRKIAIADGILAMAGGMNIIKEDISCEPFQGQWRDLSFMVEGPVVQLYSMIFASDWNFTTGEKLTVNQQLNNTSFLKSGDALLQVVPAGPDVLQDTLYDSIITSIFRSNKRLVIVTPYFIPNATLNQALLLACHRGVDVRILMPAKSNHVISDLIRGAFLRDIEEAGGTVLLYREGMVHAKIMVIDDEVAMVGSANMDMRSLFLNHEVMQFIYTKPEIDNINNWIVDLEQYSNKKLKKVGAIRELLEGVVRIIAPLV